MPKFWKKKGLDLENMVTQRMRAPTKYSDVIKIQHTMVRNTQQEWKGERELLFLFEVFLFEVLEKLNQEEEIT